MGADVRIDEEPTDVVLGESEAAPAVKSRAGIFFTAGVVLALVASVVWVSLHAVQLADDRDGIKSHQAPPAPPVRNVAATIPASYAKLPVGAETTLPFIDSTGKLHLGEALLPVHGDRFAAANWTVLMYQSGTKPGPLWIARDGAELPIPGAWSQPVLSKDGSLVYAVTQTEKASALVAFHTDSGEEAGRFALTGVPAETLVVGSDRSRVYFRRQSAPPPVTVPGEEVKKIGLAPLYAWEPGTNQRHVTAPLGYQNIIPLQRGVLMYNTGDWEARFAAIMPDQSLTQPGVHMPLPGTVADSPDGSAVVVARNASDPGMIMFGKIRGVAANMNTGKITDLRVPASVEQVYVAGFESAHSVVLYTSTGSDSWYLRCWVDAGTCDRIKGSQRTDDGKQIRLPGVQVY